MEVLSTNITTALSEAQQNNLDSVRRQVANLNTAITSNYLTAFSSWLTNWTAGRINDKSTAPTPPAAYIVGWFDDPTTGPGMVGPYGENILRWAYPSQDGSPVCDQPSIPAQAQAISMAPAPAYQVGDVMDCPVDDPWPVGHILTDPSTGAQYTKMSHGNPFSPTRVVYFYERTK